MSGTAGVLTFVVIPANAGIQLLLMPLRGDKGRGLDPGIRRDDEQRVAGEISP